MLALILALAVSAGGDSYDAQGRRDPFVSPRPAGEAARPAREARLAGVVRLPSGYVALLETTEGRTHFRRVGERMGEETIVAIDAGGLTLRDENGKTRRLEVVP
jgi:hypothetical protein